MSSNESEPWDVPVALRDVMIEMLDVHERGTNADAATVRRWHTWIYKAAMAHIALAASCEDIVEGGPTQEHLRALKSALARAMGQIEYWPRADRW